MSARSDEKEGGPFRTNDDDDDDDDERRRRRSLPLLLLQLSRLSSPRLKLTSAQQRALRSHLRAAAAAAAFLRRRQEQENSTTKGSAPIRYCLAPPTAAAAPSLARPQTARLLDRGVRLHPN